MTINDDQFYKSQSPPLDPSQLILSTLFAYLTDGVDFACGGVRQQIDMLLSGSCYAEEGHQLLCKLLHYHCSRHPAPASLAREALEQAIAMFPNNTMFLSLYLWGEMGGRVYGRVQRLISHLTSASNESAGVSGYLWSVWAEGMSAHRTFWDKGGSGAERVRNALDKGVNSAM